jgi:transposase
VLREERWPTCELHRFFKKVTEPSRVILETGSEAFAVATQARAAGHDVRIVRSTLSRTLGIGEGGVKTDVRDARCLSQVSTRVDLPSVHQPTREHQEHKTLCGMRDGLIASRTMLINMVRGWLRCGLHRIPGGATKTFAPRVRKQLTACGQTIPAYVERHLATIEFLSDQIAHADVEVKDICTRDPICQRLITMPGIGPVTAVRFVATLDTPTRFVNAAQVRAYIGLTPGERQSGDKQRRTGITKAGDAALRSCLIQAAWTMRRTRRADPMMQWCAAIELRRGKFVAVVALARKMAGILFAMWRDDHAYDPMRAVEKQSEAIHA